MQSKEGPKIGANNEEDQHAEQVYQVGKAVKDKAEQSLGISQRLRGVTRKIYEDKPDVANSIKKAISICR